MTDRSALRFWVPAGLALVLHVHLIFGREQLWGGADLVPHLRLIQLVGQGGLLHNTYAPAYHLLGALLAPVVGLDLYPRLFALAAAVLLIAGFRHFQRAARLPDAAAGFFCLTPFLLSLSWCTPRVEAAGYGLLLFGLGFVLQRRYLLLALTLALCFPVHTASALLFGISCGVLALLQRDVRALAALAVGSLGAVPLVLAHLADGCSVAEAFLFSRGGYSRPLRTPVIPEVWPWLVPLANPVALGAAALGACQTWRERPRIAALCGVWVVLYLNNVWLAPFEVRTLVTLHRGLSLLAIPVAVAAGVFAAGRQRVGDLLLLLTAAWALASPFWLVPQACYVAPLQLEGLTQVRVQRCAFQWRGTRAVQPRSEPRPGPRRLRTQR